MSDSDEDILSYAGAVDLSQMDAEIANEIKKPKKKKQKIKYRGSLLEDDANQEVEINESEVDLHYELALKNNKRGRSYDNDSDDGGRKRRKRNRTEVTREEIYEMLRQRKLQELKDKQKDDVNDEEKTPVPVDDVITIDEEPLEQPLETSEMEINEISFFAPELDEHIQKIREMEKLVQSASEHQENSEQLLKANERESQYQLQKQIAEREAAALKEEEKRAQEQAALLADINQPSTVDVDDGVEEQNDESLSAPSGPSEKLTISVRCGPDDVLKFSIGNTDSFEKLINGISKKKKIDKASIKLMFDGVYIKPNQTPEDLDMEDDDMIEMK
ncbi:ubiquitin-like protein [Acrasis kona]|uniref:Ubiquitin-like protein n=1 Tax=Acrasis kona TaxID=1008807 RepID=A0AAW2YM86_9EUKA